VTELVLKALEIAQQPPLKGEELLRRSITWAELLFEAGLPENELKESFNVAFKNHQTDFPINAVAVKNGYESLIKKRQQAILDNSIRNSQANASDDWQCPYCFNSGWCSVDRNGYRVSLVADNRPDCEYWGRRIGRIISTGGKQNAKT
jgi:hypothetical protein